MRLLGHDIGVCSWSLRAGGSSELVEKVRSLGLSHVQLALGPLLDSDEATRAREIGVLRDAGLSFTAGMIGFAGEDYASISVIRQTGGFVPDATWPARRDRALAAGELARSMGITGVSMHIGFIPPSNHTRYNVMVERIVEVASGFKTLGVDVLMETGQETASELLQFLNDVGTSHDVYVNFDPANVILYGAGDPIEAVATLGRHIRHVHIKDARRSDHPGAKWGMEVPFGIGEVDPFRFITALKEVEYTGPLTIEREGGDERLEDVATAIGMLAALEEKAD